MTSAYEKTQNHLFSLCRQLDTGNVANDTRRKNILKQAIKLRRVLAEDKLLLQDEDRIFVSARSSLSRKLPYERRDKFPRSALCCLFYERDVFYRLPYPVPRFSKGRSCAPFIPPRSKNYSSSATTSFPNVIISPTPSNKKNKDIPEGGAKGVILLESFEQMAKKKNSFCRTELESAGIEMKRIEAKIASDAPRTKARISL